MNKKQLGEKIKQLRQKTNLSQDDFAKALGVSRVTFSQIEQGERELKHSELIKISELFEVSLDDLIKSEKKIKTNVLPKKEDPFYKFKQAFLYILNQCAQKPNVGKTVLNKLLYFLDFNHFEKYMKSITDVEYIKLPKGPAPKIMDIILPAMEQECSIRQIQVPYFNYTQQRIIPLIAPDISIFSATEITEMDNVIRDYADKSADRLSDRSHNDMPYKATKNIGDTISYGLVNYRDSLYSVSERKDED
ncbi:MAG: type II toxin-antitoxin system antitoxin SocA domain-containing protein [Candidatus Absconditabacterales bacterium]